MLCYIRKCNTYINQLLIIVNVILPTAYLYILCTRFYIYYVLIINATALYIQQDLYLSFFKNFNKHHSGILNIISILLLFLYIIINNLIHIPFILSYFFFYFS